MKGQSTEKQSTDLLSTKKTVYNRKTDPMHDKEKNIEPLSPGRSRLFINKTRQRYA